MHQYIVGSTELKIMIHMLSNELEKDAKLVYPDVTEGRVHFQKNFTIEYMDTIKKYLTWH